MAVQRAGRNGQRSPVREATGSVSSTVPKRIIIAKAEAMIFIGLIGFPCRFLYQSRNLFRRRIAFFSFCPQERILLPYYTSLFPFCKDFFGMIALLLCSATADANTAVLSGTYRLTLDGGTVSFTLDGQQRDALVK